MTRARGAWTRDYMPDKLSSWEQVGVEVLMDVRDELRDLNSLLRCQNFQAIPVQLREIRRNTAKPRKRKAAASPRAKRGRP